MVLMMEEGVKVLTMTEEDEEECRTEHDSWVASVSSVKARHRATEEQAGNEILGRDPRLNLVLTCNGIYFLHRCTTACR